MSSIDAPVREGLTRKMIRLWIEHYERVLGFHPNAD